MKKAPKEMEIKKTNYYVFVTYIAITLLIIFMKDLNILYLNEPFYIILIGILPFLFLNYAYSISFIAFLIPFLSGLPGNYIIGFAVIIIVIKNIKKMKFEDNTLLFLLILIYELLHFLIQPFSIKEYIIFFLYFIPFYIISYNYIQIKKGSIKIILFSFIVGTLFLGINLLAQGLMEYSLSYIIEHGLRLGSIQQNNSTKFITTLGSNEIALYTIISIAFLFKVKPRSKLLFVIILASLLSIGLLTLSKNFIVSFIIFMIMQMILNPKIKNKLKVAVIIPIIFLIFYFFYPGLFNNLLSRFYQDESSSNRITIFMDYWEAITDSLRNLFFGVGTQGYRSKLDMVMSAHNVFSELLAIWGVFGTLIFIVFCINAIMKQLKNNYFIIKAFYFIPFILFVFSIQFIRLITYPPILLLFALSILSVSFSDKERDIRG